MENQIEKTEHERATTPWSDLPQDILGLILGKLPHSSVDVIRFRAVCKNWQLTGDNIVIYKDHHRLPWLCYSFINRSRFECEIFGPNSTEEIYTTSKFLEKSIHYDLQVYGSNHEWLIACSLEYYYPRVLHVFMYNPYSKKTIVLPSFEANYKPRWDTKYKSSFATFSGRPNSQDCEVFVWFFRDGASKDYCIASYQLYKDKKWRKNFIRKRRDGCCGMQYMNGHLLFLFDDAIPRRYNLTNGSWTSLNRSQRRVKVNDPEDRLWLIKGEGDVLVACKINLANGVCSSFCFDWTNKNWVENGLPEGNAIFISGKTGMVRPYVDDGDRKDKKDCRVFFFNRGNDSNYKCYSFIGGRMMELREYDNWEWKAYSSTLTFIEPPRIS